jgi:xanthine dehydrogenase YagS FAD-binding subunit
MQSFEWIDAKTIEQAATLLAASSEQQPVIAKAGGMDLLDLMKEGILKPARVVNLRTIPHLEKIEFDAKSGLKLGCLATLARIADSDLVQKHYPALAAAAMHAATPQVRNAASIGGNLLQRPRCWYFRNAQLRAAMPAGDALRDAQTQYHGIFDNERSVLVHASTPATALVAYDAIVHLADGRGESRTVPLSEFLLAPDAARSHDAAIRRGEVLTHITAPPPSSGLRSAYHKQTERDSYDWPICDVAVACRMKGDIVEAASIVMGWVAPTPRHAVRSEAFLVGKKLDEASAAEAARMAVAGATPMPKNQYKVQVLTAVVRRTLLAATA